MRHWSVGALVLTCLTTVSTHSQNARLVNLPTDHLPVPIIRQATNYSCGVAALMSVLTYWQVFDDTETSLYKVLGTSETDGTHPKKMTKYAQKLGLWAHFQEGATLGDLIYALNEGTTVILGIQAWRTDKNTDWKDRWEDGHYVVLIGLDANYVYVADPSLASGYGYIPRQEFLDRWHDYETEKGKRREYHHAGIFIKGKNPLTAYPTRLQAIE